MKLSTRARYALRMMLDIYQNSQSGAPVHLKQVANRTELSRGYLEQMVVALKNASLLRGISGRRGGYLLAKPAEEIRIAEVIEAVIGPIGIVNCVTSPDSCNRMDYCDCILLWTLISLHIKQDLNAYTLADMSSKDWRQRVMKQIEEFKASDEEAVGAAILLNQEEENDAPGNG